MKNMTERIAFQEFHETRAMKISQSEWTLNNIRIEKIILAPIWATKTFLEVLALPDVRHCPKLQSCTISTKTNDATLRK